mgnify:CR=1 FL=1
MKDKKYIAFEESPRFTIGWNLRGDVHTLLLDSLLSGNFSIYKRGIFSDTKLGEVKSVFATKKFYLGYEPSFIKEGCRKGLPRKNIRLNQSQEQGECGVLELPQKYYILENHNNYL